MSDSALRANLPVGIAPLGRADGTESGRLEEIEVRVVLFSVLRELVGTDEIVLRLPAPARAEDVLGRLGAEHPGLRAYAPVTRLAVNRTYAPTSAALRDGDEVALITPVSGG